MLTGGVSYFMSLDFYLQGLFHFSLVLSHVKSHPQKEVARRDICLAFINLPCDGDDAE